ncbi:hypothetical protein UPYG_G00219460 [Umbra pygmaea]|uniref:Myb-like domain-containing protein n=1 Tax=Umbra pygmaea TaxID=75934 RepID=A0ABD0WLF7_UMBPY
MNVKNSHSLQTQQCEVTADKEIRRHKKYIPNQDKDGKESMDSVLEVRVPEQTKTTTNVCIEEAVLPGIININGRTYKLKELRSKPALEASGETGTKRVQGTKKSKPKNRQKRHPKDGAESCQRVGETVEDNEGIFDTGTHINRKRTKRKDEELSCIVEPAERIFKSKSQKSQLDECSRAVEGRKTNKRLCRESNLRMDTAPSVPVRDGTSSHHNDTHDAGAIDETEHEAEDTGTKHRVSPNETGTKHRVGLKDTRTKHRARSRCSPLSKKEWQAVDELKVFIPNIESKNNNVIRTMIKYDLDRFKEFQRQGISLRTGRFAAQENRQLSRNIENFLALTGIDSASKLFHSKRFPDEYKHIQKLKRFHEFPIKIAEGLRRPWFNIYFRGGRKMFDGNSYKRRRWFSDDDLNELKKLQKAYGNDWVKISQLTGRSELTLRKCFSRMYASLGAWSKVEMTCLLEAVRDHLAGVVEPGSDPAIIRKEKLYEGIPWSALSRRVKTRQRDQCRMKWLGHLYKKITCGQSISSRGFKSLQYKVDLVKALNSTQVQDATDIDWEHIANTVGDVTPYHLQMHFHKLRVSKVPQSQSMTFCEVIDYLYSRVLPRFEELLRLVQMDLRENETTDRPREFFLLSEIFDDEDNR